MTQYKITILLIDDHPMLRNGVKQLINSIEAFDVIAEAGDGVTGVELAKKFEPDIILLDINLTDLSGLEVLHCLRQTTMISSRIVMFTVSDNQQDIIYALKNGADGYLLKDMEPEDFLQALIDIANGKMILDETVSRAMLAHIKQRSNEKTVEQQLVILTPREHEIFGCLVKGLSNKLIAKELAIVENTVKVHIKNIFKKLNFKSRMEMIMWYLQSKH